MDRRKRPFRQLDVFADSLTFGNPLAVVLDADDLTGPQMQAFAAWMGLSETAFVLQPTDSTADYRVRIFTPRRELDFAGHPSLGAATAWLGGQRPRRRSRLRQQCGVGIVEISIKSIDDQMSELAFAAPRLRRSRPLTPSELERATRSVGVQLSEVLAHSWVDNGGGWLALLLPDADRVLALRPATEELQGQKVGVVARHPGRTDLVEVRAFTADAAGGEDPITGGLHAGIARWLITDGSLPDSYVALQGRCVGRRGHVSVQRHDGGEIWIGGTTITAVSGSVLL